MWKGYSSLQWTEDFVYSTSSDVRENVRTSLSSRRRPHIFSKIPLTNCVIGNIPRKNTSDLMEEVERRYFKRPAFEPYTDMKFFDFWRLYYTAFSRAQDLLVLTCNEDNTTLPNRLKNSLRMPKT